MTGWRAWTVRAAHGGAVAVMLSHWATTGNGDYGVAAGCLTFALAITFTPRRRKAGRDG